MKIWIFIFLGGGLGSILRYYISLLFKNVSSQYPLGTFMANLLGCLLIGVFFGMLHNTDMLKKEIHLFFAVGFTGGLTTFSTFALDNVHLFRSHSFLQPLAYSLATTLLGILMVLVGLWVSKLF